MGDQAAQFLQIIRDLLSSNNPTRDAAEKQFGKLRGEKPAEILQALYDVVSQPSLDLAVREQAAVLLRQSLSNLFSGKDGETNGWNKLGEGGQDSLKKNLLQLYEAEQSAVVRRKIGDLLSSLFNKVCTPTTSGQMNVAEWPDFMPTLMRIVCNTQGSPEQRATTLLVVKEVTCMVSEMMCSNPTQTGQVLKSCLEDPNLEVSGATVRLICELVTNCDGSASWAPFTPLAAGVTASLASLAKGSKWDTLEKALEGMTADDKEIVLFFKDCMGTHFLPVMTELCKSSAVENGSRKLALEVLVTFIEQRPKMMAKVPNCVEGVLDSVVSLLLSLDDDMETWLQGDDDTDDTDNELFSTATQKIDGLASALAKNELFNRLQPLLQQAAAALLARNDWKATVGALAIFQYTVEYIEDEGIINQMVLATMKYVNDGHPRVRCMAWAALGQFAEDHREHITSEQWSEKLLPLYLQGFSEQIPRVAIRCMESFQFYGEALDREALEPHQQRMMEILGPRIQGEKRVRKMIITMIAVIAAQIEDSFAPYYPHLMPALKNIIGEVLHQPEERQLLGKTFECVSLLAQAVGNEVFKPDAVQVMEAMVKATQMPDMKASDPVKEYMLAASERICSTMKGDFVPFVPHLLPGIFEKLTLEPSEASANIDNLEEGDEVNLALVTRNGQIQVMVMNTAEMEDLQHALECVHTFVEELGVKYADFIPQTANALLPVFDFPMGEEIRQLAFECWGHLLTSARESGRTDVLKELVKEMLTKIIPQMQEKVQGSMVNVQAVNTRAEGVTTCLKKAGPNVLEANDIKHIISTVTTLVTESFERRAEYDKANEQTKSQSQQKRLQLEEDDAEEIAGDEDDEALRIHLNEIVGALMQHHPDIFIAEGLQAYLILVDQLMQRSMQITTDSQLEDRKLALFVICDLLEHLGEKVVPHWPKFIEHLLSCIVHEKQELRQPACYGTSLAAKQAAFGKYATEVATKLSEIIIAARQGKQKKKKDKPVQACADNAVTALAEILMNHQAVANRSELWSIWQAGLPCETDDEEAVKNHKLLLRLVEQQMPEILGDSQQNLPRFLGIFIDVYKTELADEATSNGIGKLFRSAGPQLEKYASHFTDKQKKKVLRIVRDAEKAAIEPPKATGGYPQ
eukprot:gnl/MRDRNA2_/MRDRNA2_90374_c0_seq1.p1 gnl/MRDRNA2_/MRDRNA2_90374_c0~~gnl/MRDRNA2_/MRDRNA2_90374_c0_seq1.p1  ORF type:complete len:1144 (-),score=262.67 gnl/MRDRNA2_/MRDRNA2_90374_c0_seq1:112-3543(-)